MQLNHFSGTNFQAKIIPSQALSAALELAQMEAKSGTKEGLKSAAKFYNSLRTIEKDKIASTFFVDSNPLHFYPYIQLGKNIRLLEYKGDTQRDKARSVMDGINKLVEGRYLRDQISDEAKDVDLVSAFVRWA